ncbi:MAG: tetratricopeptide repeat protein [Deltaproteobacteria bacterium]|jgi:hypothetical protein|nr:tetratricopeptide repeat protein [Deltaproteobacteria bacterium]
MQGEPLFLGIYANSAEAEAGGGQKVSRWHAWGLPDGNFLVQKILTDSQKGRLAPPKPMRIGEETFFADFRVFAAFSSRYNPVFPRDPSEWQDRTEGKGATADLADSAEPEQFEGPIERADRIETDEPNFSRSGSGKRDWAGKPAPGAHTADGVDGEPPAAARREQAAQASVWDKPTSFADFLAMSAAEAAAEDEAGQAQNSNYVIVKGKSEKKSGYQLRSFSMEAEASTPDGPVEMSAEEVARVEERFLADFSMTLIKLRDKRQEALHGMQKLADSSGPFAREHKFMFTDCGLAMRKRNLYALAERFHEKARGLAPQDEHILFNLARVMYESGKTSKAREYLGLSLEINPDFKAGRDFLAFVDGLRVKS